MDGFGQGRSGEFSLRVERARVVRCRTEPRRLLPDYDDRLTADIHLLPPVSQDVNPELAEALSALELDEEIPEQLYRVVAQILGFILRASGHLR